jgi:transcriptional regulator with XRE-family HTH domain
MTEREPTIRSRELGEGLRATMERAGLTAKEVADRLEWLQPTISRMLHGKHHMSETDVALFLGVCNTPKTERARLLGLCRDLTEKGWLQRDSGTFHEHMRVFQRYEQKATGCVAFQPILVPGLLQTPAYLRALTPGAHLPAAEAEERIRLRLDRQKLIDGPRRTRFTFILHESALRLAVGGPEIMSGQLHHLLQISVRPTISIRLLPASRGMHAGTSGPFMLLEFDDMKPVVYLETETYWILLEEEKEITTYRRAVDSLLADSLDEPRSRQLIAKLATELYGPDEGKPPYLSPVPARR